MRRGLLRSADGNLTVEAAMILPLVFLLLALFLRWGLMLHGAIGEAGELGPARAKLPARRIRDTDAIVNFGYGIKENLPGWIGDIAKGAVK